MEYRIELFGGIFEIACSQIGFNPKTFTIGVRLLSPSNCGLEATLGSGGPNTVRDHQGPTLRSKGTV